MIAMHVPVDWILQFLTFHLLTDWDFFLPSKGHIKYRIMGDFPAPYFFSIGETSGQIKVQNNLKNDMAFRYTVRRLLLCFLQILAPDSFTILSIAVTAMSNLHPQIRVMAFDDVYPSQTSTATVDVNMLRNENRPSWTHATPINVKIRETEPLGYLVTDQPNAVDADGVSRLSVLLRPAPGASTVADTVIALAVCMLILIVVIHIQLAGLLSRSKFFHHLMDSFHMTCPHSPSDIACILGWEATTVEIHHDVSSERKHSLTNTTLPPLVTRSVLHVNCK